LLTTAQRPTSAMPYRSPVLPSNLACLANSKRERRRWRALAADRTLKCSCRSRGRTDGRVHDAGGSRGKNVDDEERHLASGKRCVHPPDTDHYRKIALAVGAMVEVRVRTRR